jgi:hypothetical protein
LLVPRYLGYAADTCDVVQCSRCQTLTGRFCVVSIASRVQTDWRGVLIGCHCVRLQHCKGKPMFMWHISVLTGLACVPLTTSVYTTPRL